MGHPTSHLPDHLHFLSLLQRRLSLLAFGDLLSKLIICLLKLNSTLSDEVLQPGRGHIALKQVISDFVLTISGPKGGFHGTRQGHCV